jgi:hypothetical protein
LACAARRPFCWAAACLLALAGCSDRSPDGTVYEVEKPPAEPAAVKAPAARPELPEGHPPLEAAAGLPEGHPPMDAAAAAGTDMSAATLPEELVGKGDLPAWELPEGWSETEPGPMRRATLAVGADGLEVAVTSFPGTVGGLPANVNRWRRQLGLPPASREAVEASVTEMEVGGLSFYLVDLNAPAEEGGGQRMLSAFTLHEGASWFFKMTGTAGEVEAAREDFLALVRSVRFP